MRTLPALLLAALLLGLSAGRPLLAQDEAVSQAEYAARRQQMLSLLDTTSAALLHAADVRMRNNDINYPFRQENSFYYLTGSDKPGGALLLVPRPVNVQGVAANIVVFDRSFGKDSLVKGGRPGEIVVGAEHLQDVLSQVAPGVQTLYLTTLEPGAVRDWMNDRAFFVDRDARRALQERFNGIRLKGVAPLVARLREVKSSAERGLAQRAIALTGEGVLRAMRICAPGRYEYELQAEIEYPMMRGGARSVGFPSIIGSGENSLILHYDENTRKMQEGEVVVMDVGAEYQGYSADVTRTIPVNGHFSDEQAVMYDAVLRTADSVITLIRPGVPVRSLEAAQKRVLQEAGFGRYVMHGVSHQLGLDTHDPLVSDTLRPGMILTVEPGMYVPKADTLLAPGYRGCGIRIEDDVLVTEDGHEVLTKAIPRKREEIEDMMQRRSD